MAELGLKITAPQSRSSVPFNVTAIERGEHVTYVAKETGTYVIDVTYGRLTVPGGRADPMILNLTFLLAYAKLLRSSSSCSSLIAVLPVGRINLLPELCL